MRWISSSYRDMLKIYRVKNLILFIHKAEVYQQFFKHVNHRLINCKLADYFSFSQSQENMMLVIFQRM